MAGVLRGVVAAIVAVALACAAMVGAVAQSSVAAADPVNESVGLPSARSASHALPRVCRKLTAKQRKALARKLHVKKLKAAQCSRQIAALAAAAAVKRARSATVLGLAADGEQAVRSAEAALGFKAGVLGVFTGFDEPFPAAEAANAAARGAALLISWEPAAGAGQLQPDFALARIIGGAFDGYLRRFGRFLGMGDVLGRLRVRPGRVEERGSDQTTGGR